MSDGLPGLDELLAKLVAVNGSDLHLKVGASPAYRIDGSLHLSNLPKLQPGDTEAFIQEVLPDRVRPEWEAIGEADFAYGKASLGRFRVNCYRQRGSVNLVLRSVAPASKNFDELGLPKVAAELCEHQRGLILVTGPTGAGKSTTLGAMIDHINSTRRVNIITLEDPIEILHPDKMSIVSQREVGVDTKSFAEGLRRVLRQDPDVILIGEMRDQETVEAALQAAETGHLVFSTLHTIDAAETINRIVDFFPPYHQKQVRLSLASSLRGILSQRLIPLADGKGRIPAVEVLVNTERVYDRIAEQGLDDLEDVIAESEYYGMQTFDQAILQLFRIGRVAYQAALSHTSNPMDFKVKVQNLGLKTA